MDKLIAYSFLLLLYLGLSKSLSPNEFGISYINKSKDLSEIVTGKPISVVLTDIHTTGFIIKTFYHKYKIIYGYQSYEELIVRTSRQYSDKQKKFLGMSIFRRYTNDEESLIPLPPGSIFVGNKNYGNWITNKDGSKTWRFFRVYRQIPIYLGWKDFKPDFDFHNKARLLEAQGMPFYGLNNEFGYDGTITRKSFPHYFTRQSSMNNDLKSYIKTYFKENFIKKNTL